MAEGGGTDKSPIFISYAANDAETANAACRFLETRGVTCWIAPRDVKPGAQYADAIVRAINEATAVVVVMSASAMASSHVRREVERAASKHKQIIAFRIDAGAQSGAGVFPVGIAMDRCIGLGNAASFGEARQRGGRRGPGNRRAGNFDG